MSYIKEHSEFISFSVLVILVALLLNIYLYVNIKPVDYSVRFHEFLDDEWVDDLHWKILWHFPNWTQNASFPRNVGHCVSICENKTKEHTHLIHMDDYCKQYPVYIYDEEVTEEKLERMTFAEATIPCTLKLDTSLIPNAKRGIFTKYRIPKGTIYGPYGGEILSDYGEEGNRARAGGYAWKILRTKENDVEDNFNIDAVSENSSNWLRWVNSARWREEQNMIALLFNYTVYYMTIQDVEPETELLIWYGTNYAKKVLNIFTKKGSGHDWNTDVAPSRDIVICPTCPATDGPIDEDEPVVVTESLPIDGEPKIAENLPIEDLKQIQDIIPEKVPESKSKMGENETSFDKA